MNELSIGEIYNTLLKDILTISPNMMKSIIKDIYTVSMLLNLYNCL
jgi:hypothetical protein